MFCNLQLYNHFLGGDTIKHIDQIIKINKGHSSYPPNFLFYLLVNILSGFSFNKGLLIFITSIILSFSAALKYFLSKKIFSKIINNIKTNINKNLYLLVISICFFFFFPIIEPYSLLFLGKLYLGKFSPVVWHNSTTVLLFPFALILFLKQIKLFNHQEKLKLKI